MQESYLVSQRRAVEMLMTCGLSRRAAYYRLEALPYRTVFDTNVYSRIDVELICEQLRGELADCVIAEGDIA